MDNIKHLWTVLCSNSSVDQATNNVSLFNVIEQITLTSAQDVKNDSQPKKVANISLELITLWQKNGNKSEFEEMVELLDPEGKILNSISVSVSFPDKIKRFRAGLQIQGLTITKAGEYTFRILIKEKGKKEATKIHELPLLIEIKKEDTKKPSK